VEIIDEEEKLEKLEKKLEKYKQIILDTETTSLNIKKAKLV
jgi:DNA polymerase III epsilon subunit-like protein